eukprot:Trichotokara_eunicae@DN9494_c0_g1_i2.p1
MSREEESGHEPQHNMDFQASFPGYPRGYFTGILPPCTNNIGQPAGVVGYPWKSVPSHNLDTPFLDSLYQTTNPYPMYVQCMPWCAYPYGIYMEPPREPTPEPSVSSTTTESDISDGEEVASSEAPEVLQEPAGPERPERLKVNLAHRIFGWGGK